MNTSQIIDPARSKILYANVSELTNNCITTIIKFNIPEPNIAVYRFFAFLYLVFMVVSELTNYLCS